MQTDDSFLDVPEGKPEDFNKPQEKAIDPRLWKPTIVNNLTPNDKKKDLPAEYKALFRQMPQSRENYKKTMTEQNRNCLFAVQQFHRIIVLDDGVDEQGHSRRHIELIPCALMKYGYLSNNGYDIQYRKSQQGTRCPLCNFAWDVKQNRLEYEYETYVPQQHANNVKSFLLPNQRYFQNVYIYTDYVHPENNNQIKIFDHTVNTRRALDMPITGRLQKRDGQMCDLRMQLVDLKEIDRPYPGDDARFLPYSLTNGHDVWFNLTSYKTSPIFYVREPRPFADDKAVCGQLVDMCHDLSEFSKFTQENEDYMREYLFKLGVDTQNPSEAAHYLSGLAIKGDTNKLLPPKATFPQGVPVAEVGHAVLNAPPPSHVVQEAVVIPIPQKTTQPQVSVPIPTTKPATVTPQVQPAVAAPAVQQPPTPKSVASPPPQQTPAVSEDDDLPF